MSLTRSARIATLAAALGTAVLVQVPLAATAGAATTSTGLRCTITGTSKADTLKGTSGRDVICGQGGNDRITGLGGDDVIDSGSGNDTVYGGPGNDTLIGGSGADTLHGDTGTDTASYAEHTKNVRADLDGVRNDGASGENDLVGASVENLIGGSANDVLIGSSAINVLVGGNGNDQLRGMAGTDTLNGGSGSDICDVEAAETAVSCSPDSTKPLVATWKSQWSQNSPLSPKHVKVTATVTDNFSGVAEVRVRLAGPSATYEAVAPRTGGTDLNGGYAGEATLPLGAPAGTYDVYLDATDRLGNKRVQAVGMSITQPGAATDTAAPQVGNWDIEASWPDDAPGPKNITVTAEVTDAGSGVDTVVMHLVGPNGAQYGGTAAQRVAGDEHDGSYELALVVPLAAPAGAYDLQVVATDEAGNVRTLVITGALTHDA